MFTRRYGNASYALYGIVRPPASTDVTRGSRRLSQIDWTGARDAFFRATTGGEDDPFSEFGLGGAYIQVDAVAQAEESLLKALALAPDFRYAHLKLAELYRAQGRTSESAREQHLGR